MRIGLIDSGVGGLTVLKTLIKKYPQNEYIYYGDTLNLPYGDKDIVTLQLLAEKDVEFLLDKKVDIIIIACGTISSNCLEKLKNKYSIPIYDIISPTIEYLNNSNYQNIGVIATENTIKSHMFKRNINKNIYEISTKKLVPLIESNNLENLEIILDEYLSKYKHKIDVLVLGCTHYPIIKREIQNILPNNIKIIDMSELLTLNNSHDKSKIEIYFSKLNKEILKNSKNILKNIVFEIKEK